MSIHEEPDKIVDLLLVHLNKTKDLALGSVIEEERRNDLISKFEGIEREIRSLHGSPLSIMSLERPIIEEFSKLDKSIDSDALNYPAKLDYHVKNIIQNIKERKESILSSKRPLSDSSAQNVSLQQQQEESTQVPLLHQQWSQLRNADELVSPSVMKTFQASYRRLRNFRSKLCLLSFSIFPEKCVIKKRPMIYWWMVERLVTSDTEGDDTFQDLMNKGLILPNEDEKKSPTKNSCKLHPWMRRMLISVNKELKFFNFYEAKIPFAVMNMVFLRKENHDSSEKSRVVFLLKENQDSSKKSRLVNMVFNLDQSVFCFDAEQLSKLIGVTVLQLGRWQNSPNHYIEVENDEFLKGLRAQKLLEYLSLRGIFKISKLPPSITELIYLKILDLRACHHLEQLPPDISKLKNLTHLDVSECYLLQGMPKGVDKLSALVVLKGFVIGNNRNTSCQVSDLARLQKLFKLSVYIKPNAVVNEKDFEELGEIKSLRKLTIFWGQDSKRIASSRFPCISFPEELQKLDLRCFPEKTIPQWLDPRKLLKLEKLYIRGGNLDNFTIAENNPWSFKILRLRHLRSLTIGNEEDLRIMFPHAVCLDISQCSDDQVDIFWNKDDEGKPSFSKRADKNPEAIQPLNGRFMGSEVIQFLLVKFSSLLEEAAEHSKLLSGSKSIIGSLNSTLEVKSEGHSVAATMIINHMLLKVNGILSHFILLARQRDAVIQKGVSVRYWSQNLSRISLTRKMELALEEIDESLRLFYNYARAAQADSQNHNSFDLEWPAPPLGDPSEIIGFAEAAKEIERRLTDHGSRDRLAMIGIVGMAGSGKTALALNVFDRMLMSKFDITIWLCLSETGQAQLYQRGLLKHLLRLLKQGFKLSPIVTEYEISELLKLIKEELQGKRYLLVLDDVWDFDEWYAVADLAMSDEHSGSFNKLSDGLPRGIGSAIIVTSRFDDVARMMVGKNNIFNINNHQLLKDDIWSIFKKNFKYNADEITEEMKDEIIELCDGLPSVAEGIAETFSARLRRQWR